MNKDELATQVAKSAGVTKKDTSKVINALMEVITEELESGGEIKLIGFGRFTTTKRGSRKGFNPQTKEPIEIPEVTIPKFTAGRLLKEAVKAKAS